MASNPPAIKSYMRYIHLRIERVSLHARMYEPQHYYRLVQRTSSEWIQILLHRALGLPYTTGRVDFLHLPRQPAERHRATVVSSHYQLGVRAWGCVSVVPCKMRMTSCRRSVAVAAALVLLAFGCGMVESRRLARMGLDIHLGAGLGVGGRVPASGSGSGSGSVAGAGSTAASRSGSASVRGASSSARYSVGSSGRTCIYRKDAMAYKTRSRDRY
ncbi:uncharacterized protein [Triticum aestivum]|uniref:uncharacterized protein n=1 Tax=Triticum aestivum TaxID=4565 RepID=UPI001D00804F|nr:uncharacterized protein LOC123124845 [Triticum aestivum]